VPVKHDVICNKNMEEFDFERIIRENLEPLEDVELILLKGHLVIEQLITELLEGELKEPDRLKVINPMFAKKLEIYLAVAGNSIISNGLEKILKELNSLRNKLAHDLKHPEFNRLLTEWVQRAARERIEDPGNPKVIKQQLIAAVSYISAYLSGAIMAREHRTSQPRPTPFILASRSTIKSSYTVWPVVMAHWWCTIKQQLESGNYNIQVNL